MARAPARGWSELPRRDSGATPTPKPGRSREGPGQPARACARAFSSPTKSTLTLQTALAVDFGDPPAAPASASGCYWRAPQVPQAQLMPACQWKLGRDRRGLHLCLLSCQWLPHVRAECARVDEKSLSLTALCSETNADNCGSASTLADVDVGALPLRSESGSQRVQVV